MLPRERLRFYQRARALTQLAQAPHGAAGLTNTILSLWLVRKYPRLSRRTLCPIKSLERDTRVTGLADWLAQRELLDAAFWLSSAYALWVGEDVRRNRAMFFTPPELSARLLRNVERRGIDLTRAVFLDPACGGGAFLAPAALSIKEKLKRKGFGPRRILEHVRTHVLGTDVDPTLCRLSVFFLKMALYEEIAAARLEPRFRVRAANALTNGALRRASVDVLLCNPPYRKMSADEVARYTDTYSEVIEGQPNLYALFFQLALDLVKPGGVAALLTGTSYLSGEYFGKLRTYALSNAQIAQIDVIGERNGVFVGVELDTAITILRKPKGKKRTRAKTAVYSLSSKNKFERIGRYSMPNSGAAWPVPKSPTDARVTAVANGSPYRLADYGYSPRIGTFVWNRDPRRRFFSERAAKRRAKIKAAFPLIWSSDISQGGRVRIGRMPERHRFVSMGDVAHPSVVRKPSVVLQRVTSSDQRRRLVGAPVSRELLKRYGGVVGENHVVFLQQVNGKAVLSPRQFAQVLRSKPIDSLFRSISGAANVSAFELQQLPMPEPEALVNRLARDEQIDLAVLRAFRKTKARR